MFGGTGSLTDSYLVLWDAEAVAAVDGHGAIAPQALIPVWPR